MRFKSSPRDHRRVVNAHAVPEAETAASHMDDFEPAGSSEHAGPAALNAAGCDP
ncbi:MAG: hypothetical protein WDO68_07605 [Gammaproteobacteria bacterium]